MHCPNCGSTESRVSDSRDTFSFDQIRRRRECLSCHFKFTTYEIVEDKILYVVSKNGTKDKLNRTYLSASLFDCLQGVDNININNVETIADDIIEKIYVIKSKSTDHEISTSEIGRIVCDYLKTIDYFAYIKYAIAHEYITNINQLLNATATVKYE